MKQIERKFARLLAATATSAGEMPQLDARDWPELYQIAARQNLLVTLFYTAQSLPAQQPDAQLLAALKQSTKAQMLLDTQQQLASSALTAQLQAEKIRAVILKGGMLKALYAKPEMRFASDIDLWVNPADKERLTGVLDKLGFTEFAADAFVNHGNVKIETHYQLTFKNRHRAWTDYFASMQQAVLAQLPCALTPEQHYLYLLCHYIMHFESGGIGLRQTLDMWLFRTHYAPDEAALQPAYKRLGIGVFAQNLDRMLCVLFENQTPDALSEEMIDYIFSGGMYGNRQTAVTRQLGQAGGRGRYLFRRLFPRYADMKRQYPRLLKMPVLLPFYWLARIINGVLHRKKHIKQEMYASQSASLQQAEALKQFNRHAGIPDA